MLVGGVFRPPEGWVLLTNKRQDTPALPIWSTLRAFRSGSDATDARSTNGQRLRNVTTLLTPLTTTHLLVGCDILACLTISNLASPILGFLLKTTGTDSTSLPQTMAIVAVKCAKCGVKLGAVSNLWIQIKDKHLALVSDTGHAPDLEISRSGPVRIGESGTVVGGW